MGKGFRVRECSMVLFFFLGGGGVERKEEWIKWCRGKMNRLNGVEERGMDEMV